MLNVLLDLLKGLLAFDLADVEENDGRKQVEVDLIEVVHAAAFDLVGAGGFVGGAFQDEREGRAGFKTDVRAFLAELNEGLRLDRGIGQKLDVQSGWLLDHA